MRTTILICLILFLSGHLNAQKRSVIAAEVGEGYEGGDIIYGQYKLAERIIDLLPDFGEVYMMDFEYDEWKPVRGEIVQQEYFRLNRAKPWDSTTSYTNGSVVTYEGDHYLSIYDNSGERPDMNFTWELIQNYEDPTSHLSTVYFDFAKSGSKSKVYAIGFRFNFLHNDEEELKFFVPFKEFADMLDKQGFYVEDILEYRVSTLSALANPEALRFDLYDVEIPGWEEGVRVMAEFQNGNSGPITSFRFFHIDQVLLEQGSWEPFHEAKPADLYINSEEPSIVTLAEHLRANQLYAWGDGNSEGVIEGIKFEKYKMPEVPQVFAMELKEIIFPIEQNFPLTGSPGPDLTEIAAQAILDGDLIPIYRDGNEMSVDAYVKQIEGDYNEILPFDADEWYLYGDLVSYNGKIYTANVEDASGIAPDDPFQEDYWLEIDPINYPPEAHNGLEIISEYQMDKYGNLRSIVPKMIGIGVVHQETDIPTNEIFTYLNWDDLVEYFNRDHVPVGLDQASGTFKRFTQFISDRSYVGILTGSSAITDISSKDHQVPGTLEGRKIVTYRELTSDDIEDPEEFLSDYSWVSDTLFLRSLDGAVATFDFSEDNQPLDNEAINDRLLVIYDDFFGWDDEDDVIQSDASLIQANKWYFRFKEVYDHNMNLVEKELDQVGFISYDDLDFWDNYLVKYNYKDVQDVINQELRKFIMKQEVQDTIIPSTYRLRD